MSYISSPAATTLVNPRGGRGAYWSVDPLPDASPADQVAELRAEWANAEPERRKSIEAEVAALTSAAADSDDVDPTTDPTWGQS